ncbi:riboflavin kinase [Cylas formicarius]|uniref:riboflavin kinase n=1 Tax=Cylas formicarius TaxID=197179 RepID=UPI002958DEF3|nr:riboflavin kinase [Cylas formicarius]XP_060536611.1 riboflavin kinase [Cylas formicarius]
MTSKNFPTFVKGEVVKGFGRGSKQLGIPTANFSVEVVNSLADDLPTGVYYGFAKVESDEVQKMVMSIGWNPFFKNNQKSMETHIIHNYDDDFYGKQLSVVILGYLRPERDFGSLDELIKAIQNDITDAESKLEEPNNKQFLTHAFFNN